MNKTATVLLVRHGETDWNRAGRIQGWAPVGLNDRGREQASALGEALSTDYNIDRLVASDLRRTRETAALLVDAGVDAEPSFEDGWRERNVGIYQGLEREELYDRYPALLADSVMGVREQPDGGERLLDVRERVLDSWHQLRENTTGATTVVVTHGGPLAVLLGHLKGQDLTTAVMGHSLSNCTITEIHLGDGVDIHCEDLAVSPAVADS